MSSPIIWAGNNAKNLKPNLEYAESLIKTGTFSTANNQSSPADVTGFTFASTRGGSAIVTVYIDATTDLAETFELMVTKIAADYLMSVSFSGEDSGLTFSITSSGQIQYTSTNVSGFSSGLVKWNATTLDL